MAAHPRGRREEREAPVHQTSIEALPKTGTAPRRRADQPVADAPAATVRLVRDGPVPRATCPHCDGQLQLSAAGSRWQARNPNDVADRLILQLSTLEREELHVLLLNTRNVVIGQERVYQGNVSSSLVRVGELFVEAVRRQAHSILLVHNHPSGDPTPSPDDLHLTAEVIAAGRLLDVDVLDHIIVAGGSWVSLRDRGIDFGRRQGHAIGESSQQERLTLRMDGGQIVDDKDRVYDLEAAIEAIPWVTAVMYPPPHQYVIQRRCPEFPWAVLAFAVYHHPDSYRAYFRGYTRPMRYLEFEGHRYWQTASGGSGGVTVMLNRCLFSDAEPPRRVDKGALPIRDWDGPPWMPNGSPWPSWYRQGPDGVYRYQRDLDPFRRSQKMPRGSTDPS